MVPNQIANAPQRKAKQNGAEGPRCSTVSKIRSPLTALLKCERMSADGKTQSMTEAPTCYACGVGRMLRDASPVAPGYEVRSFECPKCGSVLQLVCESGADLSGAVDEKSIAAVEAKQALPVRA